MDQILLAPLEAFETSLNALIQSLTTTTTYTSAPKAASDLVAADDQLDAALIQLKTHQDNYQMLQQLRSQRDNLQQTLHATVQEAWRLRQQLGAIHPSILDDVEESPAKGVDYATLLSFASRIGKHNAIAAQEAERASEREFVEAKKQRTSVKVEQGQSHDVKRSTGEAAEQTAHESSEQATGKVTTEAQNNLVEMRNVLAFQRAMATAPFPNAEDLRKGALGRMQMIKEQYGEESMDAEVEKMVRESELPSTSKPTEIKEDTPSQFAQVQAQQQQRPQQTQQQQLPASLPPKPPAKKIDLDFPGSESDDDDD